MKYYAGPQECGGGARTKLSTFHIVFYSLWLRNVPFVSQATASLHQESNI